MARVGLAVSHDRYPVDATGFALFAEHVDAIRRLGFEVEVLRLNDQDSLESESPEDIVAILRYQGLSNLLDGRALEILTFGCGKGSNRAVESVGQLHPFFFDIPLGRKFLVTIAAGDDLVIGEVQDILNVITNNVGSLDSVEWGLVYSANMAGEVRTSVLASGGPR